MNKAWISLKEITDKEIIHRKSIIMMKMGLIVTTTCQVGINGKYEPCLGIPTDTLSNIQLHKLNVSNMIEITYNWFTKLEMIFQIAVRYYSSYWYWQFMMELFIRTVDCRAALDLSFYMRGVGSFVQKRSQSWRVLFWNQFVSCTNMDHYSKVVHSSSWLTSPEIQFVCFLKTKHIWKWYYICM